MQNKLTLLRQPMQIISHFHIQHREQVEEVLHVEDYATNALIDIAQTSEDEKPPLEKDRHQHNGSQITRWNHNYLNIIKRQCPKHKNSPKIRVIRSRQIISQNSCVDKNLQTNNIRDSFKKQLNKLRLPLRQKTLNSQQFNSTHFQRSRSKTRNDIKLEIINSKPEIMSNFTRKKMKSESNYQVVVNSKLESNQYQKIKRKGYFTIQNQNNKKFAESPRTFSQNAAKSFFLSQIQTPTNIKLKGSSIRQLISK